MTAAKETGSMGSPVTRKEIKILKRLKVNEKDIFICFNFFKLDQEFCRWRAVSAWADGSLILPLNNMGSQC